MSETPELRPGTLYPHHGLMEKGATVGCFVLSSGSAPDVDRVVVIFEYTTSAGD